MAARKRTRGTPIPLIVEDHPSEYDGYPFITLIQYRNEHVLTIVDNVTNKHIKLFVLDLCGPDGVNEENVISVASEWYNTSSERYPLSFEFSRRGLSEATGRIYRSFNIEFVTRVIGPMPKFNMNEGQSVKRRRRKPIPAGMEVHKKILEL